MSDCQCNDKGKPKLGIMIVIAAKKKKNMNDGMVDDTSDSSDQGETPDMSSNGPDTMCNVVKLGDGAIPDAKDGEEVEFHGKGRIIEEDGHRMLMVDETDGIPTAEMNEGTPEEEAADQTEGDSGDGGDIKSRLSNAIKQYSKNSNTY